MTSSFGARLRLHRERQQVALATIAERTKIKLSLLEGLEQDDVSRWPGGIFRRSYVRDYAQAIGLDPDVVVREFLERFPDPEQEFLALETVATGRGTPPTRLSFLISSAIGALPVPRVQPDRRAVAGAGAGTGAGAGAATTNTLPVITHDDDPPPSDRQPPDPPASDRQPADRVDLPAFAQLCTTLARAGDVSEVAAALSEAARLLGAVGLVLWTWDSSGTALRPALSHGYPDEVLARLPAVPRDAENALGAAVRSGETRVIDGTETATGGITAPLMTPTGCTGVLALECRSGDERHPWICALAVVLAAQLSALVGHAPCARAAAQHVRS